MRIIGSEKMENCFDSEFVFKYFLDTGWTEETIQTMEALGTLRYYKSFPRPMFQVTCPDGSIIKGLERDAECRVIFSRMDPAASRKEFETRFAEAFAPRNT
jgi:hypothetical protein